MLKKLRLAAMTGVLCVIGLSGHALAEEPKKLAFVDTGNTGRSVMAEAIANAAISKDNANIAVISRAVDGDPYDAKPEVHAASLMLERGIDVTAHRSAQLTANDIKHSDALLTMTEKHKNKLIEQFPEAKDKTFTLAEYATGKNVDVPDAWGKPMEAYVEVVKQLDTFIPAALKKIVVSK